MTKKEVKKKKSLPVRIINAFFALLCIFVCGCLVWIMAQMVMGKDPSLFGYRTMVVITESMTGTYDKGDVIYAKEYDKDQLLSNPEIIKEGDVISFIAPDGFGIVDGYTVTHRVVSEPFEQDGKWYVWTKGDANSQNDKVPIPLENIQAKVLGKSSFMAKLHAFLSNWYGFVLVIVIPLTAIGIWQVVEYAKAQNKQKLQKQEQEQQEEIARLEQSKQHKERKLKEQAVLEYIHQQQLEKQKDAENQQNTDITEQNGKSADNGEKDS